MSSGSRAYTLQLRSLARHDDDAPAPPAVQHSCEVNFVIRCIITALLSLKCSFCIKKQVYLNWAKLNKIENFDMR
ncbi:unnamed protein product [Leptidea sinapis]|uniref:Uncharacterized protein n=1 Tax=Leptidea sinapis TaxID=189913 RepID=A0A5E4QH43_9NEOP|nr:unnamed protein product [Leptidea sinapis]